MSKNPFDNNESVPSLRLSSFRGPSSSSFQQQSQQQHKNQGQTAIWAARNVDWPLPASLSLSQYKKLVVGQEGNGGPSGGTSSASPTDGYFRGSWMRSVLPSTPSNNATTTESTAASYSNGAPEASRPLNVPLSVATANGWIVAALESPDGSLRLISRWNVRRSNSNTSAVEHLYCLPPPKGGTNDFSLAHIFCDPTGCHTFVSSKNGELYYLHSNSKSVVALLGCGGICIPTTGVAASVATSSKDALQHGFSFNSYVTAIAWDRERGTEGSTKHILLGTNFGEIYEYALSEDSFSLSGEYGSSSGGGGNSRGDTSHMPTLLHKVVPTPIVGLYFERSPVGGGLSILVATTGHHTTRLYSFFSRGVDVNTGASSGSGGINFRNAFGNPQLMELPGTLGQLQVRLDSSFGLLTSTGMYYGTLQQGDMITQAGLLPYTNNTDKDDAPSSTASSTPPLSMALTPHHIIFLYPQQVVFINRISQKVIQRERLGNVVSPKSNHHAASDGELLVDIRRPDQVWLRKGRSLVHISSSMEDRDVWKYTLQMCIRDTNTATGPTPNSSSSSKESLFEQTKSLCSNSIQKAVVTKVRAEYYLQQSQPILAAKYLASCPPELAPFSDTALRLAMRVERSIAGTQHPPAAALIAYLSDKLRAAGKDDPVMVTMLGAWLTELYLYQREQIKNKNQFETFFPSNITAPFPTPNNNNAAAQQQQQNHNTNQLQVFLSTYLSQLDASTILRILSSHDVSASECAPYANAFDLSTAVQTAQSPHDALKILQNAPLQLAEPLYYRHASVLLSRAPLAASKSFLSRYSQGLSPEKLLPSLMEYERRRREHQLELELKELQLQQALENKSNDNDDDGNDDTNNEDNDAETADDNEKNDNDNWNNLRVSNTQDSCVEVLIDDSSHGAFVDDETACVKYLEGVIQLGCRGSAIFSYLISLYVRMDDEEPLLEFLRSHVPAAATAAQATQQAFYDTTMNKSQQSTVVNKFDDSSSLASPPLDMSYALRTILSTGRHFRSAIHLYMGFGLRQQAVELALKVDPSLARELAQGETVSDDERKRLWLMIARNAATDRSGRNHQKDVVAKVVAVLKDCGSDVLSIEDVLPFLPDFCQIDQIKDEICDALTSYSSKIEGYLSEMNECDQTCDALRDEIRRLSTHQMQIRTDAKCAFTSIPILSAEEPFYVFPSGYCVLESALLEQVMPFLNTKQQERVKELREKLMKSTTTKTSDQWQAELDGLIAADCPLTGSIMVESIDHGFPGAMDIDEQSLLPSKISSQENPVVLTSTIQNSLSHNQTGSFVSVQPSQSM